MLTKIMKWTSLFALLGATFLVSPGNVFSWVIALCCSMFLASLLFLNAAPSRLSMVSIAYTGPRSESLDSRDTGVRRFTNEDPFGEI
jgi:hypothetical protein